mmetsp:Transcript_738/g.941  ORF Transcript_738/g.941 Transcript_738/m.941 type:complete len:239 (-) Transcript_738:35-751(-)
MDTNTYYQRSNDKNDESYKIVLLGAAYVGKTNLLKVLLDNQTGYSDFHPATLSPEMGKITLPHPDGTKGKILSVTVWDTAGQERYRSLAKTHYRNADGAILVFDVSCVSSFTEVGEYLGEVDEAAGDSLAAAMLIMNKIDLLPRGSMDMPRDKAQYVQEDEVQAYRGDNNFMYARTTAKFNNEAYEWDGQTIQAAFSDLVNRIYLYKSQDNYYSINNSIRLNDSYYGSYFRESCGDCS